MFSKQALSSQTAWGASSSYGTTDTPETLALANKTHAFMKGLGKEPLRLPVCVYMCVCVWGAGCAGLCIVFSPECALWSVASICSLGNKNCV